MLPLDLPFDIHTVSRFIVRDSNNGDSKNNSDNKNNIKNNNKIKIYFPEHFIEQYFDEISDEVKEDERGFYITGRKLSELENIASKAYNCEVWYEPLEDFTFKSVIIDMSDDEIKNFKLYPRSLTIKIDNAIKLIDSNGVFVKLNDVSNHHTNARLKTAISVIDDILKYQRTRDNLKIGSKLFIREFVNIRKDQEFRCFVCGGVLRAVSQYYCDDYFESLQGKSGIIKLRVTEFFNKIKNLLPYYDCILDIAMFGDDINFGDSIKLIEINEYGDLYSGSALFNWKKDYEQLFNGKEVEIRIRDKKK